MDRGSKIDNDQQMLEQLRLEDPLAFEQLYRRYYRMVASMVASYGGTDDEARDLFQEVLLVLVRKVREPQFELTARMSTYLYAVAKNLLLKKKNRQRELTTEETKLLRLGDHADETYDPMHTPDEEALLNLMNQKMKELEDDCRRILLFAYYDKLPHAKIAEQMGYTEGFVKVKKHRCLDYLRKLLQSSPLFRIH